MRKWFRIGDTNAPKGAPANCPVDEPDRADTLQIDINGECNFTDHSDDRPQPLELIPIPDEGIHAMSDLGKGSALEHFPDHFHEGEVLGFGGVKAFIS
ncbi:MAG: hypothetical protein M1828_004173 [Chrysothrix sp. TS-e1954]|nr:MAG: hypothetical protein M1828_004173 [Chrysothrix sp. TS-e1954]